MSVSWTAPGGRAGDWIAVFRMGASYEDEWYGLTNGAPSGTHTLTAPARPGQYEFRYLVDDGFMDVARLEFRLSVPDDLCVVGFDDIPEAGWLGYNLTTFRQPIGEIADHIVGIIARDEPDPAPIKRLPTQVAWRKSVRP